MSLGGHDFALQVEHTIKPVELPICIFGFVGTMRVADVVRRGQSPAAASPLSVGVFADRTVPAPGKPLNRSFVVRFS